MSSKIVSLILIVVVYLPLIFASTNFNNFNASSYEYHPINPNDPGMLYLATFAVNSQNKIELRHGSKQAPLQLIRVIKAGYSVTRELGTTVYSLNISAKRHVDECLFETDILILGLRLYMATFKLAQSGPCT